MTTLRPYQVAALDALRASVARGNQRVLLVAPTGSGKTTVAAEMIRGAVGKGGAVLFLAHRKELIDQCSARLDGIGVDHGVIQAGHQRLAPWCPVQVASIPTLARRLDHLPRATLIIVDEAHHARAVTYADILAHYPSAPVVGLTATPWRLDNKGLGELFGDIVVATTPRQLIAEGYLVPYTGYAYDVPDTRGVAKAQGDYEKRGLELVMSRQQLAGNIVDQWLAHCRGKRTAVFAVSVKHSQDLCERFRTAGVAAEHLDGSTPKEERKGILRRLEIGATHVVCNVNVLTEGWDLPQLEVIVLARPTLSIALYLQMVGRGMRPAPGKEVCRIHDHAGCIARHGLPDAERDYALSADPKQGLRTQLPALRVCQSCFATYLASLPACPACGYTNPAPESSRQLVEVEDATAVPLEQLQRVQDERERYLEEQLRLAREKGRKPGWAAYRYKERFGEWPPNSFWARHRALSAKRLWELNQRLKLKLSSQ